MRGAVFLAMFALACADSPSVEPLCTPGESRACACPSGASGAQLCADNGSRLEPCTCSPPADHDGASSELDAALEVDAGSDAGVRVDAGLEHDASLEHDAGPMLEPDSGPAGQCTAFPQSGCPPDEVCRWLRHEAPRCEPVGHIGEHEDAYCFGSGGRDLCHADLFCAPAHSGYSVTCRRPCDPQGEPCPDFWSTERARWLEQECVAWDEGGQVGSCLIAR